MIKDYFKAIRLFLKSSNFYRGVVQTIAVIIPLFVFYSLDQITFAIPIALGVFLNAPGNAPGTLKRKFYSILISTSLIMAVTLVMTFAKANFSLLVATIAVLTFFIALISAYGFRGSLMAFSGLLAVVLSLAREVPHSGIGLYIGLIGLGGIWFLVVISFFHWLAPKKEEDQLLSETLFITGSYLKTRGDLLVEKKDREPLLNSILQLQTQLNEKHEILRELLLSERLKKGRSNFDEKRVLIFISLVDILELALANTIDYKKIDVIFEDRKALKKFKQMNLTMGKHLQVLSEIMVRKKRVQSKKDLLAGLSETATFIEKYIKKVKLPEGREGILILRNLYDYQEQQVAKVRAIRRVMNNVNQENKISLLKKDVRQFITTDNYSFNMLFQHLTLQSPIFRHSLRLTIAVVFGFLLGTLVGIKNPYWIMLTLVVLMRPSYGLTKERAINRIIGTLIGATFATLVILLTSNTIVYIVLATISLTIAFSLLQQSYKSAAAFITVNIIFIYALLEPNSFVVIKFRVIDTAIGALLAVIANYTLWPTWEFMNLKPIIIKAINKNKAYLLAVKEIYHTKDTGNLNYKLARKEAFLGISNLNAAFQRMTQDPKSKQKEVGLIYEIVSLNNTFLSALASTGSFIQNHETTSSSAYFDAYIAHIENQLENSESLLDKEKIADIKVHLNIETAQERIKNSYEVLSKKRDQQIKEGKTTIDKQMRLQLQEALMINNQLTWLKTLSEDIQRTTKKYNQVFNS